MNDALPKLLVVDDDEANRASLMRLFEREGFAVSAAANGAEALGKVRSETFAVVLTDLMMPGMDGIELLRGLRASGSDVEVVMMTAHGTIETAVSAMRAGAYDFVEKPLKRVQIVKSVRQALERHRLVYENRELKARLSALEDRSIIGASEPLLRAVHLAEQAAPSSATILVLGESGTGKELLARHIHRHSGRAGEFVAVNLAALPEGIIESELFGHERGAFTGAVARRVGRFARARGGTLFLDEVAELSPPLQVKLLRVLQERQFEVLGGGTETTDARIIVATNRNLQDEVDEGRFREDLYYRLNVIPIRMPRLADRLDDIPLLVEHFLEIYTKKNQKLGLRFTRELIDSMLRYSWPGNVRELENTIERLVVLAQTDVIDTSALPEHLAHAPDAEPQELRFRIGTPLAEMERVAIERTLQATHGDKALAAKLLGIAARTIYRKLDGA